MILKLYKYLNNKVERLENDRDIVCDAFVDVDYSYLREVLATFGILYHGGYLFIRKRFKNPWGNYTSKEEIVIKNSFLITKVVLCFDNERFNRHGFSRVYYKYYENIVKAIQNMKD